MPQQEKQGRPSSDSRTRERIAPPRRYQVIFHNDDVTTMDFVVEILKDIFCKSNEQAVELMLKVHHEGRAVIAVYTYDIARTKQRLAMDRARAEGFPFRIDIESE